MSDRLRHVIGLLSAPWAITPDAFEIVCDIIDRRAAGIRLSDDEIRALVETSRAEAAARHAAAMDIGQSGRQQSLAIISLYGVITPRPVADVSGPGSVGLTTFMQKFQEADADPQVAKILLDIDSPGGNAALVPEAAAIIRSATKPVTAIANYMAGSAAYWLASQADEIVATPSAMVGSVGVLSRRVDITQALTNKGIKVQYITYGRYKAEGWPEVPITDDEIAGVQAQVDELGDMFVADIARGRGSTIDEVASNYGQGRILTAQAALGVGMVDRVDTFDGTVRGLLQRQTSSLRASAKPAYEIALTGPEPEPEPDDKHEPVGETATGEDLVPIDQGGATAPDPEVSPVNRSNGQAAPTSPLSRRVLRSRMRRVRGL